MVKIQTGVDGYKGRGRGSAEIGCPGLQLV